MYGKLIYSLYGAKTENSFVKSWGMGLAIENATQFQARAAAAALEIGRAHV